MKMKRKELAYKNGIGACHMTPPQTEESSFESDHNVESQSNTGEIVNECIDFNSIDSSVLCRCRSPQVVFARQKVERCFEQESLMTFSDIDDDVKLSSSYSSHKGVLSTVLFLGTKMSLTLIRISFAISKLK